MSVNVDKTKCVGCGICVDFCPVNAIAISNRKAFVDKTKCTDCGFCIDKCPKGALSMENVNIPNINSHNNLGRYFNGENGGTFVSGQGRGFGRGRGLRRGIFGYGQGKGRGRGKGNF